MTLTIGIDEAGRGAVVGPLVMYGVVLDHASEKYLAALGVDDSKKLTPDKRKNLSEIIQRRSTWARSRRDAKTIDTYVKDKRLNELEREMAIEIIMGIMAMGVRLDRAVLDGEGIFSSIANIPTFHGINFVIEAKADQNYIAAAAASICAKHHRDTVVRKIMDEGFKGGSGYPNNATEAWIDNLIVTSSCLAEIEHSAQHIRRSWKWKGLEALKEKLDAKR